MQMKRLTRVAQTYLGHIGSTIWTSNLTVPRNVNVKIYKIIRMYHSTNVKTNQRNT